MISEPSEDPVNIESMEGKNLLEPFFLLFKQVFSYPQC